MLRNGTTTQTYKASRLGMEVYEDVKLVDVQVYTHPVFGTFITAFPVTVNEEFAEQRVLKMKRYELTDHQSSVHITVSDRKLSVQQGTTTQTAFYTADVISYGDYYPFGMQKPGRVGSEPDAKYRYKHQGQESDSEILGEGNSYAYEYRMSDARLGRFWSLDPLSAKYAYNSPYAFSENRLIDGVELEGLEFVRKLDADGNPAQGEQGGYNYVGFNEDGTAREGSVPGAFYHYKNSEGQERTRIYYYTAGENGYDNWQTDVPGVVNEHSATSTFIGSDNKLVDNAYNFSSQNGKFIMNSYARAPWVSFTYNNYLYQTEIPGPSANPVILSMSNYDKPYKGISNDDGINHWCGCLVGAALAQTEVPFSYTSGYGTFNTEYWRTSWPESVQLKNPVYGAVAVMSWGHVGFIVGRQNGDVLILGGNQSIVTGGPGETVNIKAVPLSSIVSIRLPVGYKIPKGDFSLSNWQFDRGKVGGGGTLDRTGSR